MKCLAFQVLLSSCLLVCTLADQHESMRCKTCKKVEGYGPLAGFYELESESDARCQDGCSYARGNDLYCFVPGEEVVVDCGEIGYPTRPTQGEEMVSTTKPEMKPVTFEPAGTDGPPAGDVKCGMRRGEGECIKDGRIVNGQEAGCNEWPWQVGIVARAGDDVSVSPFCGGTLINENHVITAAHCLPGRTTADTAVMIGDHDLNAPESAQRAYGVSEIFNHPLYNDDTAQNDIAVLRLSVKVNTTMYTPACFPTFTTGESLHGKNGTISGWGALEYNTGDYPDTLQEAQDLVPIVNRDTCVTDTEPWIYDSDILPGMLCAGGPGLGIDTCQGDSGGPLTNQFAPNRYQLVGVVSWGRSCAESYGVYSDVAYYRDWIEPITGQLYMTP